MPPATPLLKPDEYFDRTFPRGSLAGAVGLVVGGGIAAGIGLFVLLQTLLSSLRAPVGLGSYSLALVVGAAIGMLIVWVVLGGLLHVGTAIVGGKGSFKDTLVVSAWGTLPSVFATFVGIGIVYFQFSGATTFAELELQMQQLTSRSGSVSLLTGIPFTLWQTYVLAYGLKHARNLRIQQAAGVAVVVGVLLLTWSLV